MAKTQPERFWRFVVKSIDCWVWTGTRRGPVGKQYGQFWLAGKKKVAAHRWAYESIKGPIPHGLQLDHLCKNKLCVNPSHLEAVTPLENTLRGTNPVALNARKTHCMRGHEFTQENTMRSNGTRNCRRCCYDRRNGRRDEQRAREKEKAGS